MNIIKKLLLLAIVLVTSANMYAVPHGHGGHHRGHFGYRGYGYGLGYGYGYQWPNYYQNFTTPIQEIPEQNINNCPGNVVLDENNNYQCEETPNDVQMPSPSQG